MLDIQGLDYWDNQTDTEEGFSSSDGDNDLAMTKIAKKSFKQQYDKPKQSKKFWKKILNLFLIALIFCMTHLLDC